MNEEDTGNLHEAFVFVDSLTHKHTAPDLTTSNLKPSSPTSPFKGKTATECSTLLKNLAEETGAYILDTVFAIFDDRPDTARRKRRPSPDRRRRARRNAHTPRAGVYEITAVHDLRRGHNRRPRASRGGRGLRVPNAPSFSRRRLAADDDVLEGIMLAETDFGITNRAGRGVPSEDF